MRQIVTIIFTLTTLFFAQNAYAQDNFILPEGNFEELSKDGTAYVDEAVSPLTLRLQNGKFIHLAGLDIPDFDVHNPGEFSETTVNILNDFLKGQQITLYKTKSSNHGRINRMGHYITHVARTNDNVWVQGLLVSLGVARVRTTKYNPEMSAQLYKLEKHARTNKRGLWSMEEYKIRSTKQVEEHIGSFQVIEGKIRSVARRKNRIYLNFGDNWKEDFTVSISPSDARSFERKGINPQSWNGENIRVRGWVSYRNGPYIEIDHPERFEHPSAQNNSKKPQTLEGSALPNGPRTQKPKTKKSTSALPNLND